jgi:hypothetical protein
MMSAHYSRSRFISVFKSTGRHLGRWEVFSDFLSLAASELDIARIRTPESMEHCRKISARYEASDIANMQEMFCLMVCALEAKFHDFLGAIFMELELGDNFAGSISRLMGSMCLLCFNLLISMSYTGFQLSAGKALLPSATRPAGCRDAYCVCGVSA